jgi:hypothetical protein
MPDTAIRIACFISPHGFGHAARAASIMLSLNRRLDNVHFDIFTEVPQWFFSEEGLQHSYHCVGTDVGFIQNSPLEHDIGQTLAALDRFVAGFESQVNSIAEILTRQQCRLALCDISPLGIAAAHKAGIPSVLIENFTWDWMYEQYVRQHSTFELYIDFFRKIFQNSDHLIQTEPACDERNADLLTYPVSRTPRTSRAATRQALSVPDEHTLVTITMGGIPGELTLLDQLAMRKEYSFVLPGTGPSITRNENCIILPQYSAFYHPDLIHASDIVIGKLGYSTLAEVYYTGAPFVYVMRDDFRESGCLARFVAERMPGLPLHPDAFSAGHWLDTLPQWRDTAHPGPSHINGAEQAAHYIYQLLGD